MPIYNKLVRDRIPKIIQKTGKNLKTEVLDNESYITELKKKLNEEVAEYQESDGNKEALEELADILELIHALSSIHNGSIKEVEQIREKKKTERGGFDDKIFLLEVED
ncbi:nucleoside triphosphate pyrophosphohydrolase [Virgibacillus siamensis]|uniref:nucleoside triphosphate pyrophosphohydrolase n=1 Tax=Virgibacillus siamensis TaxID=480071 RepID=UPI0009857BDD|nr:nucleoside triphosphate pyrophosphohydrolase [Virgibacillus siamensis]